MECEISFRAQIPEVTVELEKGNQEDTILLNFSKAFDKVSHTHKLRRYIIGGRLSAWIEQNHQY